MSELDNCDTDLQYHCVRDARSPLELDKVTARLIDLALGSYPASECEPQLAREYGYSLRHLARAIEAAVGESVTSFIRRIRLERAAGQLSLREKPVARIGERAGFATTSGFTHAFEGRFGSSPTEFAVLNPLESALMPGYLLSEVPAPILPGFVRLRISQGGEVSLIYDGPILLGRVSCGVAVWTSR